MRRWASYIVYVVVLIVLVSIAYLTRGSPFSQIVVGTAFIVIGAGWWTHYADIYKGPEFTPWRKFMRLTHTGFFVGFGLWGAIDGLRKVLTA